MKKDGTRYLALVKFRTGEVHWEIVHWGTPVGLSDGRGTKGWVNSTGFSLREPTFLESYPFLEVIKCINTNINITNSCQNT